MYPVGLSYRVRVVSETYRPANGDYVPPPLITEYKPIRAFLFIQYHVIVSVGIVVYLQYQAVKVLVCLVLIKINEVTAVPLKSQISL
ncbi:hypothetical protein M2451_004117 [Dysgonomonas sp. PFB1-18]|nr:hypothetical protein [Dysgonomonas sp. PF1-14]MDH6341070.1 hypothetical protein [Dysgonomonas sp. PF1-16]MDH6382767.1 hypothetical protein [Dysgonomonas sp. PFB1-18]MDH6400058.1 hypothetical protein [Dysgonomonas sp. PF1-23]